MTETEAIQLFKCLSDKSRLHTKTPPIKPGPAATATADKSVNFNPA